MYLTGRAGGCEGQSAQSFVAEVDGTGATVVISRGLMTMGAGLKVFKASDRGKKVIGPKLNVIHSVYRVYCGSPYHYEVGPESQRKVE